MPHIVYTTEHAPLQTPVIESGRDPAPEPPRPPLPANRREPKLPNSP